MPSIAIIIVTYNTGALIKQCLDSIDNGSLQPTVVILVDNASHDETPLMIENWIQARTKANEDPDYSNAKFRLIRLSENTGFAGGVNSGLAVAMADANITHFWLLNPDTELGPETIAELMEGLKQTTAHLIGSRIEYIEPAEIIQSDGGVIDKKLGICRNIHGGLPNSTPRPNCTLDFVSGANMIVTRRFVEEVGEMCDEYFLYYEEVDWALRGKDLGLGLEILEKAVVYHVGGSTIGTKTAARKRSPLSSYFLMRGRILFMRKFFPNYVALSAVYSLAQCAAMFFRESPESSMAALKGVLNLAPPAAVQTQLSGSSLERTWQT